MGSELPRVLVEPTGKAVQDRPTKTELAQDFAAIRGWTHPGFETKIQNNIFDPTGKRLVADNFTHLAWLMDRHEGFTLTSSGAWQIHPTFNALSDEDVFNQFGV